jgi:hypothetical protein
MDTNQNGNKHPLCLQDMVMPVSLSALLAMGGIHTVEFLKTINVLNENIEHLTSMLSKGTICVKDVK